MRTQSICSSSEERYTPAKDELQRLEEKADKSSMSEQEFERYEELHERDQRYREIKEQVELLQAFTADHHLSSEDINDLQNIAAITYHSSLEFMLRLAWTEPLHKANAILTIQGLRGCESLDSSVDIIMRAYERFAQRRELTFTTYDADENCARTVIISGDFAYATLRCEEGVHKIRYNEKGTNYTGYFRVDIVPEVITAENSLVPKDLAYRVSNGKGCGGQHKDKKATCVTITHTPSGLSASARSRSLELNRKNALRLLTARVACFYQQESQNDSNRILPQEFMRVYCLHGNKQYASNRERNVAVSWKDFQRGHLEPFMYAQYNIPTKF